MKQFIGMAAGMITALAGFKAYSRWRDNRDFDLFMNEMYEDDELNTIEFHVGDNVKVMDPFDPYADMQARRGQIEQIRIGKGGQIYVFKLKGDPEWYNQNWIVPDPAGPETWSPYEPNPTELDYWLATLSDSRKSGDAVGAEEANEQLRKIIGGEVD